MQSARNVVGGAAAASSKLGQRIGKFSVTSGRPSYSSESGDEATSSVFERVLPLLLKKFLEREVLLYFVAAVKHNKKGKMQDRLLVITDAAVYNLTDKGKFVRENRTIAVCEVSLLTVASDVDLTGDLEARVLRARADGRVLEASRLLEDWVSACKRQQAAATPRPAQFVLHVPSEYDYRFSLPRRGYSYIDGEWAVLDEPPLEGVLGALHRVCGRALSVRSVDAPEGDLRNFVQGDKDAGRNSHSGPPEGSGRGSGGAADDDDTAAAADDDDDTSSWNDDE